MKGLPRVALCALLLLLTSCVGGGYDLQRLKNDEANYAFSRQLADDYIAGKPLHPITLVNVSAQLDAWQKRLDSDAKVLGVAR
tara:strand:- start:8483 stop:8731 length:249 start_codon:yes stop_codon:yes gene_type:complete